MCPERSAHGVSVWGFVRGVGWTFAPLRSRLGWDVVWGRVTLRRYAIRDPQNVSARGCGFLIEHCYMWKFVVFAYASVALAQTVTPTVVASGLQVPYRVMLTPRGSLLVSEGGAENNGGRISVVSRGGNRTTLLAGLPSGRIPKAKRLSGLQGLLTGIGFCTS